MKVSSALALLAPLAAAFPSSPGASSPAPREAKVSYDGYHVYSIRASSQSEARALEERFAHYHTVTHREAIEVAVPPHEVRSFQDTGLEARLVSDDLGKQIREEDVAPTYNRRLHKRGGLPDLSWFDTYHDYEDHLQYWDDLAHAFRKNSKKYDLGPSYEGRSIYAFNFWGDKGKKSKKPVILWHATVHAREWISTLVSCQPARV